MIIVLFIKNNCALTKCFIEDIYFGETNEMFKYLQVHYLC